jgi:hypothetical protein
MIAHRPTRFLSLATLALALALPGAAAAGDPMLLVTPRSRGLFCDSGEGCSNGLCASDPTRTCGSAADCPGCLMVENEDVALCRLLDSGAGTTACDWSLFFDGSAAGLSAPILALDILPDGSLLLRAAADNSIPDIAGANRKDLVRFVPTDDRGRPRPGSIPYAEGEWRLFLDGDAVERNSDGRLMSGIDLLPESCRDVNRDGAVELQECDLVFSPFSTGTFGDFSFAIEDLIRCRPTLLSEGRTVEACDYSLFYDASAVNDADPYDGVAESAPGSWRSGGTVAFAVTDYDPAAARATLYFAAGNETTLPLHQPSRDLLRNQGTFGPTGVCSSDASMSCLGSGDCSDGGACLRTNNPQTDSATSVFFDGSIALGGEMLAAVAVVADGDGDGVPDPLDNCPLAANPGACAGSGAACSSDLDCATGERCRQADSDDDGVGDACDRCADRNDAECFCGDGITDRPSEQCDLGAPESGGHNGVDYSPCTADCRLIGRCTRSGDACTEAETCPAFADGEGCCGNGVVDAPAGVAPESIDEMCDDANAVGDDGCDNTCRVSIDSVPLPQECEGLIGPQIVPTFVRTLRFQKQRRQVAADREPDNYSKWSTRGEFSLVPGVDFDPDTQHAEIIFNQGEARCDGGGRDGELCSDAGDCPDGRCSGTLYRATLPPGAFAQAGMQRDRPRWSFKDRNGRIAGAPGWTKGRFSQRLATIRRPLNEVRFMLQGRGDRLDPQRTLHLDPEALGGPPTRVRQTIVVGNLCTTQSLVCEGNRAGTTLQCFSKVE